MLLVLVRFFPPKLSPNAKVSELINDARMWKNDPIKSSFLDTEAPTILKIPLCGSSFEDKLIWDKIQNEFFFLFHQELLLIGRTIDEVFN